MPVALFSSWFLCDDGFVFPLSDWRVCFLTWLLPFMYLKGILSVHYKLVLARQWFGLYSMYSVRGRLVEWRCVGMLLINWLFVFFFQSGRTSASCS